MARKSNSIKNVGGIQVKTGENLADKHLQNDNVFVTSEVKDLSVLTGMPCRKGYENAIISNGEIVNIVSNSYGHLPNENYFSELEIKLLDADIKFVKRSINKNNRSFAVDYILNDEGFVVKVKNSLDEIVPMIRLVNSYDGSIKTSGSFGFFRKVCSNGLHVANTSVGFSVKHSSMIESVVMPEINGLVLKFMDNEFYTLSRKFEVLAERALSYNELHTFIKSVCDETKVFSFAKSDKNPEAGLNAGLVVDTIMREATLLRTTPNQWLAYNAINELLHNKFEKSFEVAKNLDAKIFDAIYAMS